MKTAARFAVLEEAIGDVRAGRPVVVYNDASRYPESAVVMAAQFVRPDDINFMAREAHGLICLALPEARCEALALPLMARNGDGRLAGALAVSIEARDGVSTGISAADRAHTIHVAIDPASSADDLVRPGHVFPLRAAAGGVLERADMADAAVDLARLAGVRPASVLCTILDEDGMPMPPRELVDYCRRHGMRLIAVSDLVTCRLRGDPLVERVRSARTPTRFGELTLITYRPLIGGAPQLAAVRGDLAGEHGVPVWLHRACPDGDIFGARSCDCGAELQAALSQLGHSDRGAVLYLPEADHGARGCPCGPSGAGDSSGTSVAVLDPHTIAARILADLGVASVELAGDLGCGASGLARHGVVVEEAR